MLRFLTGPVEGKWATALPVEDSIAADENRKVAFSEQRNSCKTAGTIYFLCQPSQRSKQTEEPFECEGTSAFESCY